MPAWLKGFAMGRGWGGATSGRGGTRCKGRGCALCTTGAAAEPQGAADTGAAFWPVVRFVTDLYVNQPVSRVHPIILHKVISRRRRGRDNWIEL